MSPSYNSMREPLNVFLRVLPWLMTTVSANVIHYFSLWIAREEAHRQVLEAATPTTSRRGRWYPGSDPEEHERLSFDLMDSPAMRKARYLVKLIRYGCTLLYVALFYEFLPELSIEKFSPGLGTIEALVVGVLGGLVTLYLNENGHFEMRTGWRPDVDYGSEFWGWLWDGIRVAGAFATPVEDSLMYHSWIYRTTAILVTVLVARLALFRREYIECLRSLQDPFRTKKGDYCAQEVAFICSRPSS